MMFEQGSARPCGVPKSLDRLSAAFGAVVRCFRGKPLWQRSRVSDAQSRLRDVQRSREVRGVKRRLVIIVLSLCGLLALEAQPVTAANTSCGNRQLMLAGTAASMTIGASTSAFFGVPVVAGRSYVAFAF